VITKEIFKIYYQKAEIYGPNEALFSGHPAVGDVLLFQI
jgi:hypothetical protein